MCPQRITSSRDRARMRSTKILAPMALPVLGGLLISDEVVDFSCPCRFIGRGERDGSCCIAGGKPNCSTPECRPRMQRSSCQRRPLREQLEALQCESEFFRTCTTIWTIYEVPLKCSMRPVASKFCLRAIWFRRSPYRRYDDSTVPFLVALGTTKATGRDSWPACRLWGHWSNRHAFSRVPMALGLLWLT